MNRRDLERLGHHVVSRRVALGYRNRTDLAESLQFTVRTLADIEHGVRKASPGTYAMLENKLAWTPGSIDTILAGGEPKETVPTLRRSNTTAPTQGYALRPTNPNALSQVSTEELLLELRRRIIAPRNRRHGTWDDRDGPDPRGDRGGLDPHGDAHRYRDADADRHASDEWLSLSPQRRLQHPHARCVPRRGPVDHRWRESGF